MKKFSWLVWLVLSFGAASTLFAVAPDFSANYRFTNRVGEPTDGIVIYNGATRSLPISNYSLGCVGWELDYNSEGLSGVSVNLQTNTKSWLGGLNFGPGNSWSTFSGTNSSGTLPMTSTSQGTYIGYAYFPYVAVNLATFTGTGSVDVVLKCWKSINYASSGGGAGVSIAGDVTGSLAASVVAKVNGATVLSTGVNLVYPCKSSSGSGTVYTCTTGSSLAAYADGMTFNWEPDSPCSGGATTLNVDSIGAKSLVIGSGLRNPTLGDCAIISTNLATFQVVYNSSSDELILTSFLRNSVSASFIGGCTSNTIPWTTTAPTSGSYLTCDSSRLVTAAVGGSLITKMAGLSGIDTSPGISGCSATIGVNSRNIAGFYTSGTTGTCGITLTWSNTLAYPVGASCSFTNITTAIDAVSTTQTGGNTTTVTASGTTVSGDVIKYLCIGY